MSRAICVARIPNEQREHLPTAKWRQRGPRRRRRLRQRWRPRGAGGADGKSSTAGLGATHRARQQPGCPQWARYPARLCTSQPTSSNMSASELVERLSGLQCSQPSRRLSSQLACRLDYNWASCKVRSRPASQSAVLTCLPGSGQGGRAAAPSGGRMSARQAVRSGA